MRNTRSNSAALIGALFLLLVAFCAEAQEKIIVTATDTIHYDIHPDEEEYKILAEFYRNTNGRNWTVNTNWLKGKTSADMAKWYGVIVRDGDVSEIHLPANNVNGIVSKNLYSLHSLTGLTLDGNSISEEKIVRQAEGLTSKQSVQSSNTMMSSSSTGLSTASTEVVTGKNLPAWGLAVEGPHAQQVDWRTTPPLVEALPNSDVSKIGTAGVAIDDCGRLAFYVLHSGTDIANQLHIRSATGAKLTNDVSGDSKQGLNCSAGDVELQVVRVPGTSDEWYIIYSEWKTPCTGPPLSSGYCPAKVVYTRVKYNDVDGLVIQPGDREIPVGDPNNRYIQGKAVSRSVNGDDSRHFLYLAQRGTAVPDYENEAFLTLHRFIIDEVGINYPAQSPAQLPAEYWYGGIAGSSIELSPDETKVAVSNRNISPNNKQEIIIFDLAHFNSSSYEPTVISIPNLVVSGTGKTIAQHKIEYPCFNYIEHKLSRIEFSPSGRYLYATNGGYPGGGGRSYNTYLLQLDLQSGSGIGDYDVRMQIERGYNAQTGNCQGPPGSGRSQMHITSIQTAYDGRLYFTKGNSSQLFVIPNPDDPMPHSLEPHVVDLSTTGAPNIPIGSKVLLMPENIDGLDYLKENTEPAQEKFQIASPIVDVFESVILNILDFDVMDRYQVAWGDGSVESISNVTSTHTYSTQGQYKVTLTALTHEDNCASITSKIVTVVQCPEREEIAIEYSQWFCASKFSVSKINDCRATYEWDFGDGSPVSKNRVAMHVYETPGEYLVTVKVTYGCLRCQGVITRSGTFTINDSPPIFEDQVFHIESDQRDQIISSSATTFSDSWLLDHHEPSLEEMNPFVGGAQGVWRSEGSFVYNTSRSAPAIPSPVSVRTDGTYTMDFFNWTASDLQAIPKWTKANSMTRYSPFGFDLENKDVLDVYSAALYGYDGQLPVAQGSNMRNDEMAYTGFEDMDLSPAGNLVFRNEPFPTYTKYNVVFGYAHMAVVESKLEDIQNATRADIKINGFTAGLFGIFPTWFGYMKGVNILCKSEYSTNPNWTLLVFEKAPKEGLWYGEIGISHTIVPLANGVSDNTIAHTGKRSLRITSASDKTFEQRLVKPVAGTNYHLSAWVSVNNPHVVTPTLGTNLGIDVLLKNKSGVTISSTLLVPEGPIIEGWQQVKGSFLCPEEDLIISLRFKHGTTGAWYDDLRIHPDNGNLKSYVYDPDNFRLHAILDENNFASIFFYDQEGNLYLTKKETEQGIQTITEAVSYQVERQPEE